MSSDLKTGNNDIGIELLLNKACFLDQRFNKLNFLTEDQKKRTIASIEEEAVDSNDEQTSLEPPAEKRRCLKNPGLMSLLEDVLDPSVQEPMHQNRLEGIKKEIKGYSCLHTTIENPLQRWSNNEKNFPHLATLARKYLCVPATSVPSERAFSTSGYVVNDKRSCLLPENVNKLVFGLKILTNKSSNNN